MGSLATLGIVITVTALVAFSVGWKVESWRMGEKVAHAEKVSDGLKMENTMLRSANDRAAKDVKTVQGAFATLEQAAKSQAAAARVAIKKADAAIAVHGVRIAKIRAKPEIESDKQCEVMVDEQLDYVKNRLH